jgi:lipoprotein-anchoring transpeptidase ErfK/SrfK
MSLPSQSSRNATRSSQVHYRRSRANPARKIITIVVIIAALALVWFTIIRPRAARLASQDQTNTETINDTNANTANTTTGLNQQSPPSLANSLPSGQGDPIVINNSPTNNDQPNQSNPSSRLLPGAGDRPNASEDVERARTTNNTSPSSTTQQPTTNTPNEDLLTAAARQGENQPQSGNQTQSFSNERSTSNDSSGISLQLSTARRLIAENNSVQARKLLSQTLLNANITHREAQLLRDELTVINDQLVFSPVANANDPMCENYKIQSGDSLSRIAGRRELATHWKLISRVNQIADPSRIRLGQNIKLVRGPFHAIVNKSQHRIDIFHGSPADPKSWLFIRSFDVGLGSNDGTPIGEFVVSANKLENPGWVNPRNAREQYDPNDPANPIGEYWIGLTGVGQYSSLTSLGIHGTIDPESIGGDESMGCVRLADGDIDLVYELLAEHISRVLIVP